MLARWLTIWFLLFAPVGLGVELSADFCRLVHDWRMGRYNFYDMCLRYPGNFCLGIANEGQGMCRSGGLRSCDGISNTGQALCELAGARPCSFVKNTSQGICVVLEGTQCLQRNDREDLGWIRRLEAACEPPRRY